MYSAIPQVEEVLDRAWNFIRINRCEGKKCFWGWTEDEVKGTLLDAMINKAFLMCGDIEGNVIGVVHGRVEVDSKLFFVGNILTIHPSAMKTFIQVFDNLWPGYSLYGMRFGKTKYYNTPRFKSIMKGRK